MDRHNNFDGLRLIAAGMVLCSHQFALLGLHEPRVIGGHTWGSIGVLIFFSISGYLVSASWARDPDLGRFLAKRFLRIVPGLVVAVLVTYAVIAALGLQGFVANPRHEFNGSLWTIPLEVYCYLALACLALVGREFAAPLLLVALVVYLIGPPTFEIRSLSYFALYFGMGAVLHRYPRLLRLAPLSLALGAYYCTMDTRVGLAFIIPPLAVLIGTRSWPVLREAGRYGDLSYGVYIYAWPVGQLVVAAFGRDQPYPAMLAVSGLITVALAYLSWRFVEAPALKRKPSTRSAVAMPAGGEVA